MFLEIFPLFPICAQGRDGACEYKEQPSAVLAGLDGLLDREGKAPLGPEIRHMPAVDTARTVPAHTLVPTKPAAPKKRDRSPGPKVYKKGAGFLIRWRYRDPRTGKREEIKRKALASTITGARQEARALEREVLDSFTRDPAASAPKAEVPTILEFLPIFESMLKAEERALSTRMSYASNWRKHIAKAVGNLRLDEITAAHFAAVLQHCDKEGLAPLTKRQVLASFRRGLMIAKSLGHVASVPDAPRIKQPEHAPVAFTPDESNALVDAGEGADMDTADLAMLYLGLHGGMRCGEVCALRGEDFRELQGEGAGSLLVTVCRATWHGQVKPTKSGKARTLTLTVEASTAVRAHLATLEDPRGWLFPSRRSNRGDVPVENGTFNRCMRRLCKASGVPYKGTHKARKTAATALARAGKGAWQIAAFLGHSGIEIARVYVDRNNAQDPQAAAAISAYSGRKG